ncbi:MAG: hypothetical protein ACKV0T_19650, partial [Planctomycetales bacterium]
HQVANHMTHQVADHMTHQVADHLAHQLADPANGVASGHQSAAVSALEEHPKLVPHNVTEQVTDQMTKQMGNQVTHQPAEHMAYQPPAPAHGAASVHPSGGNPAPDQQSNSHTHPTQDQALPRSGSTQ